ncbi:MAG: 30S ribosomal protein S17 [Polyangiaceae bacterium]
MSDKKTTKAPAKAEATKAAPAAAKPKAEAAPKSVKAAPKSTKAPKSEKAAPAAPAPAPAKEVDLTVAYKTHSFRRKMIGTVLSDKMNKTVVVEVIRKAMDPVYKKYVRNRDRYKAHDENNLYKVGDRVEITEHAPISRDKRWLVTRLLSRRVEA